MGKTPIDGIFSRHFTAEEKIIEKHLENEIKFQPVEHLQKFGIPAEKYPEGSWAIAIEGVSKNLAEDLIEKYQKIPHNIQVIQEQGSEGSSERILFIGEPLDLTNLKAAINLKDIEKETKPFVDRIISENRLSVQPDFKEIKTQLSNAQITTMYDAGVGEKNLSGQDKYRALKISGKLNTNTATSIVSEFGKGELDLIHHGDDIIIYGAENEIKKFQKTLQSELEPMRY